MACLDPSHGDSRDEPLRAAVARCNSELEAYLEGQRHELRTGSPHDELRGLARQLRSDRGSDRGDATAVVRRVRRILGRVDAQRRGGSAT